MRNNNVFEQLFQKKNEKKSKRKKEKQMPISCG